jgi:transcriptional regulator with PAS, ATPase and Fis domain
MADSDSSILIHGETGTGKELFAQAIHNESQRRNSPFVAVNCGAFHENILESELFGYEEGAFTGARKGGKIGFFELAHNGTIFLDEISEMSKNLQVKILRVLQEKEIMKLGSDKVIDVNIRVIAASNKNLKDLMKKNDFRKDLYYRLNILPLEIPPLRSRPEDIEELIIRFKRKFGSDFSIDSDCMSLLFQHKWDGNVRELRNIVEYLTNLGKKRINLDDIPLMDKRNNGKIENTIENERIIDPTILDNKHTSKYMFVLKTLYESRINRKRIGRRGILNVALENNFFISEKEIRNIIEKLESNSFVLVEKGRAGTSLTESGISLFQKLYKS